MKKIIISLVVIAVLVVGFIAYRNHMQATNPDLQQVQAALDQSQAAAAGLALNSAVNVVAESSASGTPIAQTSEEIQAQHLLNSFQGVLDQMNYKLQE